MEKHLFLGDEAIAQAAIDAGISGVYAYPGTPSTEITEYIQGSPVTKERGIHCRWSANEKTAMEAALGMCYAGKRALCCMKHVGLNVAADCFMNAAMSGINGGMIILTADDPSMHSSQNEQDNRVYGNFAMIPMFEPSSQQEAYDMVYHGVIREIRVSYLAACNDPYGAFSCRCRNQPVEAGEPDELSGRRSPTFYLTPGIGP